MGEKGAPSEDHTIYPSVLPDYYYAAHKLVAAKLTHGVRQYTGCSLGTAFRASLVGLLLVSSNKL